MEELLHAAAAAGCSYCTGRLFFLVFGQITNLLKITWKMNEEVTVS